MASIFTYMFAFIGLLAMVFLIYYIYLYYSYKKGKSTPLWPSSSYMKYMGAPCPTGWELQGTRDGKDICKNIYDVRINPNHPDVCYSDIENKTQEFNTLKTWPIPAAQQQLLLEDRCDFVRSCGAKQGQYATWFGIADLC